MKRAYTQKKRAEAREQTRRKIVEAAVELHQEKGILATSISDVAARAKVGKVTVYRHFPDETALTQACSGHYFERHPFPDINRWKAVAEPRARLRYALEDTYRYHRETEPMMARVLVEAREHPVVKPYHAYWRRAVAVLAAPWPEGGKDRRLLRASLTLAVAFETWQSLVRRGRLSDGQAVDLMMRLVSGRRS